MLVVLGDPICDRWIEYETTRRNPEDPRTSVVERKGLVVESGGALNVALNLGRLLPDTVVYIDPATGCRMRPIQWEGVPFRARAIPTKTRHIIDGRLMFREDADQYHLPRGAWCLDTRCDVAIVVDYGKGAVTGEVLGSVLTDTPFVVFDLKPTMHRLLLATGMQSRVRLVFKANHAEAQQFGIHDVKQWYDILKDRFPAAVCVITNGSRGAEAYDRDGAQYSAIETYIQNPVSICGAGDVFTAAFTAAFIGRWDTGYALREAHRTVHSLLARRMPRTLCVDASR